MSIRDDAWQSFLGRTPQAKDLEEQMRLKQQLHLDDNDPFWGIAVFFYFYYQQVADAQKNLEERLETTLLRVHEHELQKLMEYFNKDHSPKTPVSFGHKEQRSITLSRPQRTILSAFLVIIVITMCAIGYFSFTPTSHTKHLTALDRWAINNPEAVGALLQCHFSSHSRIIMVHQQRVCYPAGEGIGYYLDTNAPLQTP